MKVLQEFVRFNQLNDTGPTADDSVLDEPTDVDQSDSDVLGASNDLGLDRQDQEAPESQDPNRQGIIRTVKGAHLVYKREVEDGTYEELWQYNTSTLRDEITIRKAILAGTDIPVNKAQSPDGSQSYETWTAGNAELLLVKGLTQ